MMRLKGVKTMRQAARWLRSRWGQQVLILGYHRVADVADDPYGVVVRPSHFAAQMATLRREAHPISLMKAYEGLQTGQLPRRAVVVTFDDGYTDILWQARPLLAQYDIPFTAFVVAGCLGQKLWWDELAGLIMTPMVLPEHLQLNINGRQLAWSILDPQPNPLGKQMPTPRQRLLRMLYEELRTQPEIRPPILAELRTWSSAPLTNHDSTETGSVMSPEQLATLTGNDLVEIGSHTMTHATLPALSAEAQMVEIRQSKAVLEEIVRRPVVSFTYPHGGATAVTQKLVQEAGYKTACASQNGLARQNSNPYLLPRFWPPDWDGKTFARWLRRWLHG
ncbi:MAG TPA: polysaccharide deacetylase family protein [Chloroflexota bacterium]|nr:polysaccharide deacetylase family protein [Chloroflexota bacterium]